MLIESTKLKKGAKIFLHPVKKPSSYGVAKINKKNKVLSLVEKPQKFFSRISCNRIYFFDNNVINLAKKLKPSKEKSWK